MSLYSNITHLQKSRPTRKQKPNTNKIKKQLKAHQKAPIDYISPWEAQHQQMLIKKSQNAENLQEQLSDSRQDIVQVFLEKIKKSHRNYRVGRVGHPGRNGAGENQENLVYTMLLKSQVEKSQMSNSLSSFSLGRNYKRDSAPNMNQSSLITTTNSPDRKQPPAPPHPKQPKQSHSCLTNQNTIKTQYNPNTITQMSIKEEARDSDDYREGYKRHSDSERGKDWRHYGAGNGYGNGGGYGGGSGKGEGGIVDVGFGMLTYSKLSNFEEEKQYEKYIQRQKQQYNTHQYHNITHQSPSQKQRSSSKKIQKLNQSIINTKVLFNHKNKRRNLYMNEKQSQTINLNNKFKTQVDHNCDQTSHEKEAQSRRKLFTDDEKKRAFQIVFVKKKKCNNKATVININDTAQQFYQQQIRYTQDQMLRKYRKLASKKQQRNRCQTQQNGRKYSLKPQKPENPQLNRSLSRNYTKTTTYSNTNNSTFNNTSNDRMQELLNRDVIRRKYSFMNELKDQSVAERVQNMMRYHLALANSILINK